MFAYVYYIIDKQLAKVPVSFVKNFEKENYAPDKVYKVFWSRFIHSIQNEDPQSLERLRSLTEPPSKVLWKFAEGERYYSAFILRVEESLDILIESIKNKRPNMPMTHHYDDGCSSSSTAEDEVAALKFKKKQTEAEIKKKEQTAKRSRAEEIFNTAKRTRRGVFKKLEVENDSEIDIHSDSDEDPEVVPRFKYTQLEAAYQYLEQEKEKVDVKLKEFSIRCSELQKQCDGMELECQEISQLRLLNRQLQEKLLSAQGGCFPATGNYEIQNEDEPETIEIQLGAGISINRSVYKEMSNLDHVRKFTKSLAVAIWGSTTLANRSVKGMACRNRNGPKKSISGAQQVVDQPQPVAKMPLTPEKLAVISGQMREYLLKRGKNTTEVENEIKNRNRYISDKIQDICSNIARVARNKSS